MKYHYQYVSSNSVRIELIPEDRGETNMLKSLKMDEKNDTVLKELFQLPLSNYMPTSKITRITFMEFPKVALITFDKIAVEEKNCA